MRSWSSVPLPPATTHRVCVSIAIALIQRRRCARQWMCSDCRRHCIRLDTHEEPLANVFAQAEVYLLRSVIVMCFCIEFAFSIQIEKETNEKSLSPDREPPSAFVFRLAAARQI